jgi:hypothetical protein
MTRITPYLSEEAIERDAAALLHEYARARGAPIEPPIPLEDIVEKHLKLGIEFDDTHKLFGVPRPAPDPDILGAIFFGRPTAPSFICRSSEAKKREEWHADFCASCLLMPRKLVFAAWDAAFPDRKPRVLQPRTSISHPYVEIRRLDLRIGNIDCSETDDEALDRIAKPFAETPLVSPIAMRIRLEKLGLLHREVPRQRVLGGV